MTAAARAGVAGVAALSSMISSSAGAERRFERAAQLRQALWPLRSAEDRASRRLLAGTEPQHLRQHERASAALRPKTLKATQVRSLA